MDELWDESIVRMFYFETDQLIERIDSAMLVGERSSEYSSEMINEILRAIHSIKGAAATMK